jgi:hypothetical protein
MTGRSTAALGAVAESEKVYDRLWEIADDSKGYTFSVILQHWAYIMWHSRRTVDNSLRILDWAVYLSDDTQAPLEDIIGELLA